MTGSDFPPNKPLDLPRQHFLREHPYQDRILPPRGRMTIQLPGPVPLLRQISNFFLPHQNEASSNAPFPTAAPPADGERARLLPSNTTSDPFTNLLQSASDRLENRPLSEPAARPSIRRGVTVAGVLYTDNTTESTFVDSAIAPAQPVSSGDRPTRRNCARPYLIRAATSTSALTGRHNRNMTTAFSRFTQVVSDKLELGPGSSRAHKNAPPAPSNWDQEAHQKYILRIWDAIDARAANAKVDMPTTARIVSTERNMLHAFPELGEGSTPLTRNWIEYVLGVALRHPFCTSERMGRWELLASSGGDRGTWGPW